MCAGEMHYLRGVRRKGVSVCAGEMHYLRGVRRKGGRVCVCVSLLGRCTISKE